MKKCGFGPSGSDTDLHWSRWHFLALPRPQLIWHASDASVETALPGTCQRSEEGFTITLHQGADRRFEQSM